MLLLNEIHHLAEKRNIAFNALAKARHFNGFEGANLYADIRNLVYSKQCKGFLQKDWGFTDSFLTHSGTAALEIAAIALGLGPGDEFVVPSYAYVSTASAFARTGATPVFVDIERETLAIDIDHVEQAITDRTKAIVLMHYGGIPARDLEPLIALAKAHHIALIEDAATGFGSTYKNEPLGSWGTFGALSFDVTKHISAIRGGMLLVNDAQYADVAARIYHNGTNRPAFEQGKVPYYEWTNDGSKFAISELSASYLAQQLEVAETTLKKRKQVVQTYEKAFNGQHTAETMAAPNGHLFALVCPSKQERNALIHYLAELGIEAFFHYIPLHSSPYGKQYGRFVTEPRTSEEIAYCLVRLPVHTQLSEGDVNYVIEQVKAFWK